MTGFVTGQSATITQPFGSYDSAEVGSRTVTAGLSLQNFAAAPGTLLSNYMLPTAAIGAGAIAPAVLTNAPTLADAISSNMAVRNLAPSTQIETMTAQAIFGAAVPRTFIPYPAPSTLSTWQNNGFGSLPTIMDANRPPSASANSDGWALTSGRPLINRTEQILLQGGKDKSWRILLPSPPTRPAISLTGITR